MGLTVLKTPVRCPQANAFCERLIGTIRRECLDWLIVLNERHLRAVLREWVAHDTTVCGDEPVGSSPKGRASHCVRLEIDMRAQHFHEERSAVPVVARMVDVLQASRRGHAAPDMRRVVRL